MPVTLFIIDNPEKSPSLERAARAVGSHVQVVNATQDPAGASKQAPPDIIIVGEARCLTFFRERETNPDLKAVPVIVSGTGQNRELREKASSAGVAAFIREPIDRLEFATCIANLLRLRKLQMQIDELEKPAENRARGIGQPVGAASRVQTPLAKYVDLLPAMLWVVDRAGHVSFVNDRFSSFFDIDAEGATGKPLQESIAPAIAARLSELDDLVYNTGATVPRYEEVLISPSGANRVFLITKAPVSNSEPDTDAVLTTAIDITERKQAEEHLQDLAHYDLVTGLANRFKLNDQMRRELARARRGDRQFALHLIDLDDFKTINDQFGHQSGDELLRYVAEKLTLQVRDEDTVARLGGDEFAVIQTEIRTRSDAVDMAERLMNALNAELTIDDRTISPSGSIGVAIHPADGQTTEDLLRSADLAMYRAKASGRDTYCFFSDDITPSTAASGALEAELRRGLVDENFVLHFQPLVDLRSGEIRGGEALIRLQIPDGELLYPSSFLPAAEASGDIVEINSWVLEEACRQAVRWQDAQKGIMRVSVNLSPVQFRQQDVFRLVANTLEATGLPAELLELELTENIVMRHAGPDSGNTLDKIRKLGVSIAIDDFGTSYASLSYVRSLPANRLKIDHSFIRTLLTSPRDGAVVRAIIGLGHTLEMQITAEGVESADQVERLRAEACDEIQGNLISKPLPALQFLALCRERKGLPAPAANVLSQESAA